MSELMPQFLDRFPGAALEITSSGNVISSNGQLDKLVGHELAGTEFALALEASSQGKWRRLLTDRTKANAPTWELAFDTGETMESIQFIAIWSADEELLWLVEQPRDPKTEHLYRELTLVNSELSSTHRELARERSRLARALQNAEQAVRTRNEVLAIVSHDLRNPMNTIRLAAGLLEMNIGDDKKQMQIDAITRSVDRMTRLIADLLDVGAIEAGHFKVELAPISPASICEELALLVQPQAAEKEQHFSCTVAERAPIIMADQHRLLQALVNLVGNAVKFTPRSGEITVRVSVEETAVVFHIEDSGPGIPPDDVAHIFERYWRASRRAHGGTGLGLAISKGIVEAHGGKIWVQSGRKTGTHIAFSLPLDAR